jgi:uncharacterized membrane protein
MCATLTTRALTFLVTSKYAGSLEWRVEFPFNPEGPYSSVTDVTKKPMSVAVLILLQEVETEAE